MGKRGTGGVLLGSFAELTVFAPFRMGLEDSGKIISAIGRGSPG